jgi:RND family efflux transporter MFP subunit
VKSTLEAARLFATGAAAGGALSQQAVTVAEGVLRAMSMTRLKIVTFVLLVVGLFTAGVAFTRPALDAAPAGDARQGDPPGQPQKAKSEEERKAGAVAVRVIKPQPGGLERTFRTSGTALAFEHADLFARTPGVLKGLTVDIGDRVKAGQLLAEIDAPLLALEEKQAAAAVKQVKGQVREAEARVAAVKAEVRLARGVVQQKEAELQSARAALAFQQNSFERIKKLAAAGTIDARLLEEKGAQLEAARGTVASATAALDNAKADVDVKQGKLGQAEAALDGVRYSLESAELALEKATVLRGFARIVSPVDGVVTRRNFHSGDYLRTGGTSAQTPVLTVLRTDRMRVVTQVPERDVPLVERGLPVELTFPALPGVRLSSKVARIGFALDEKTRSMRVEIDVPNLKQQLRPGMYGGITMRLKNTLQGVLRVPNLALVRTPSGEPTSYVYVVRDGKAHQTRVELGTRTDREVEIRSGLEPNDLVVSDPTGLRGDVVPVEVRDKVERPQ